jgi:hypothetical protein
MLAPACAHKPVADRIAEHDRVRESWEQTARFIGLEWSHHAIPDAFADRALERAREELSNEKKSLAADLLPDADRDRLGASLDRAISFVEALHQARSSSDESSAVRIVERAPMPDADSLLRRAELK